MTEEIDYSKYVDGYQKGFIDSTHESDHEYTPELVSNRSGGYNVQSVLIKEMMSCSSLEMSVAFITKSGIEGLLGAIAELGEKKVPAKIITTDYLFFSDPEALDKINSFDNIQLRMFRSSQNGIGLHTKGYVFHRSNDLHILVGSSNLTQNAISKNLEWNTKLVSLKEGLYAKEVSEEFDSIWNDKFCVDYSIYRDEYAEAFNQNKIARKQLNEAVKNLVTGYAKPKFEPNQMQVEFTKNILDMVNDGKKRALLISATGTGKTYASAFAARALLEHKRIKLNTNKILFVSHREQINNQALESYQNVFGTKKEFVSLAGRKNLELAKSAKYLFSTVQTLSKDDVLNEFTPNEFAIIILDECHRSGADSYSKIIEHFNPRLLLGMSASPDRPDGIDVYDIFDHNIAYEIRLKQAIENDMLCPFHYFGITDLQVIGDDLDENDLKDFTKLTSDARVDHVIKWIKYYGHSGDRVKGLMFCRTKKEAKELSAKFNARGLKTLALSGEDNQDSRKAAIERLISDNREDYLDYIITIDIFNEGVDIPEINQIVMMRPTESPIIFVQQLGRGLRKAEGKEFVTIVDFIGNYENNYMIPIALTSDRTGNKDNIRRGMIEGSNFIKGASTIFFDAITRDKIYKSIDSARLDEIKKLKADYTTLKNKLGRVPHLLDFDRFGELDPLRIISKCGSYYEFLVKYDNDDYSLRLNKTETEIIRFISEKFASGKRPHELELLSLIIQGKTSNLPKEWEIVMHQKYGTIISDLCLANVLSIMANKYYKIGSAAKKFANCIFLEVDGCSWRVTDKFSKLLSNKDFVSLIKEIIEFGISRYRRDYSVHEPNVFFNLNKKYTYDDVFRLLDWKKNQVSLNIGGYKYDKTTKTYPVFINYEKAEDISATTNYQDRFTSRNSLIAISKSKRTVESADVKTALESKKNGIRMDLFVRKNKDDNTSKEFYYLGRIEPDGMAQNIVMADGVTNAVEIGYRLQSPVNQNLYDYITGA